MQIKRFVKNIEDAPEALRGNYVKSGDGYKLVIEDDDQGGADDADVRRKLDEFRRNNINVTRERDEIKQKLAQYEAAGVDPAKLEELRKMEEMLNQVEEGELIKKGKWNEVVERKVNAVRQQMADQVKKIERERDETRKSNEELRNRYGREKIATEVANTFSKLAVVNPGAMPHLQRSALEAFKYDYENNRITTDATDPDTGKPLDLENWSKLQMKEAPYFFEQARGTGASGGGPRKPAEGVKVIPNEAILKPSPDQISALAKGTMEVAPDPVR